MEAVEQLEAEEEALRRELRSLEDLAPAPYNPRRMSGEARTGLEKSLASFGDIAGIVWNARTGNLVCGHQRLVALRELARAQGGELRLEGSELVVPSGARFRVRVVDWPALREKQANIAANSPHIAGEFDDGLQALLEELEAADAALFADLRFDQFLDDLGPLGDPTRAGSLTTRFGVPPFSVLDTRQGYWMDRRQEWLDMGIASGAGREENLTFSVSAQPPAVYALRNAMRDSTGRDPSWEEVVAEANKRGIKMAGGTSIFDPVLAEIAVRWFCPPGGTVLDPFAGGSVRGIVTGFLGRQYVGIDVRPEQIEANLAQLAAVRGEQDDTGTEPDEPPTNPQQNESATVRVKVSAAMARLPFNGCDPDYIRNVCRASCCHSSSSPTGTSIAIGPDEVAAIEARGGVVKDGLLQPRAGEKRCPFKEKGSELCGLHQTPDKPFGCIASPFTLNKNGTLIVRNRYRLLKCYNDGKRIPAYRAFEASLVRIFGEEEAARIVAHLDAGGGDIDAHMPRDSYNRLTANDATRKRAKGDIAAAASAGGAAISSPGFCDPEWIVGDSCDAPLPESCDLVFSCPPYADLEVYSDDPRDISNMDFDKFMEAYRKIIARAVATLREDRFAVFVVGDVRDKEGRLRNLPALTVQAFEDAGATFYNDGIILNNAGSAAIRAGGQFQKTRKLARVHQYFLVFVKGDGRRATEAVGDVEFGEPEPEETAA